VLFLIGSIIFTSWLTLSFKIVARYKISTIQSIVFNYILCVITGSFVNGIFPINSTTFHQPWFPWACIMGTIFISLFNVIALTAQKIGVAVASVANKLSLIIPFLFSLYLYNEKATILKIAGIAVALTAVLLTCWPGKQIQTKQPGISRGLIILLPLILFLASGLLDTMIKYVEHSFLNAENQNAYLITAFSVAAGIGVLVLILLFSTARQKFEPRSVVAGICIGVPNYFSIWCLLRVLKENAGNSSAIIPINNMGIVLFSTVIAWLFLEEKLSGLNWAGIILSLGAIALIAFG
jgi:drug/metabolite transporter (DMT)-like permease